MIHPSYTELMNVINKDVEPGEQPAIQSRYSLVIATSKRLIRISWKPMCKYLPFQHLRL